MTLEQQGAYFRLLNHAWLNEPAGTLPDDDAALAFLSGLNDRWQAVGGPVRAMFTKKGAHLVNARLMQEVQKQIERREKASKAGKASAGKRFQDEQAPNDRPTSVEQALDTSSTPVERPLDSSCGLVETESNPSFASASSSSLESSPASASKKNLLVNSVDWAGVTERWNKLADINSLPSIRNMDADTRRTQYKARVKESPDFWEVLERELPLLQGKHKEWFSFPWLLKSPMNFPKLAEGNYRDRSGPTLQDQPSEYLRKPIAWTENGMRRVGIPTSILSEDFIVRVDGQAEKVKVPIRDARPA